MKLTIECRNCHGPLEIDEQVLANAAALGVSLSAEHDVCPGAETAVTPAETWTPRRFRAQILVYELAADQDAEALGRALTRPVHVDEGETPYDVEPLTGIGHTVVGRNLAEAVNGPITEWLNRTWPKVQESAAFADLPTPAPHG